MLETEIHVMVGSEKVATIRLESDEQPVTLVMVRRTAEAIEQRFPYSLLRRKKGMQMQGVTA